MTALWLGFIACIGVVVLLDLYALHRGHVEPSPRAQWRTAVLYFLLAAVFAACLGVAYEQHWLGLGTRADAPHLPGREAAVRFFTAFVWQLALDLDAVFVFTALFAHLRTPPAVQHRVLVWAILPALAVRGVVSHTGAWMLDAFTWTRFLVSGFLILAALRMLIIRQENLEPSRNMLLGLLRRVLPFTGKFDGSALISRVGNRLAVTPLLVTVVLLATAEAYISLDSLAGVLAISREPFIVFSANAFALLCLRSLYGALQGLTNWLRFVKVGLACSLAYAAVLMSLPAHLRPTTGESLAVVVLSLAAGVVIAIRAGPRAVGAPETSALGPEADRVARRALAQARKIIAMVLGGTLLLLGVFMLIGPGPGIPVVFIALAILGNEFAWARRLVEKYRDKAEQAVEASATAARRRFKPWVLIPMVLGTVAAFVAGGYWLKLSGWSVALAAAPPVLGQLIWGYIAFYRAAKSPPAPGPGEVEGGDDGPDA